MNPSPPTRIGLVANPTRPEAAKVVAELTTIATERHLETVELTLGDTRDVDVVVGVGGDGTLLAAARIAHALDRPVVGVNLGTVGYLTEFEPDRLEDLFDTVSAPEPPLISRMTLAAASAGHTWHGINDVVVEKVMSQRIVRIGVEIDGHHFTTYRADGIIVSTPLGSTAYSLSAGGPVVAPELEVLVLTPVAPHSLLSRSIVLSPDTTVRFTVVSEREARVNLDGREACTLAEGDTLTVRRGERPVRFISTGIHPFPQGVRKQFGLDHA